MVTSTSLLSQLESGRTIQNLKDLGDHDQMFIIRGGRGAEKPVVRFSCAALFQSSAVVVTLSLFFPTWCAVLR